MALQSKRVRLKEWIGMRFLNALSCFLLLSFPATAQGVRWVEANDGLWGGSIKQVTGDPNASLFAVTNSGSGEDLIYRSRDGGRSWTALDTGAPETFIAALAVLPDGALVARRTASPC